MVRVRGMLHYLSMSVSAFMEYKVSVMRFQDFILMDETEIYVERLNSDKIAIEIHDAALAWPILHRKERNKTDKEKVETEQLLAKPGNYDDSHIAIENVTLSIQKGELVGICGSVGSGKSALLLGLLNQLNLIKGTIRMSDSCAYVGQQAWILNSSLRDNILLGEPFDKERYEEILDICSLSPDIERFPAGDLTEIGEKGINISGGQKQRISIARALYANRDIYLMDDPLSALDPDVGKNIFERVIKGILRHKTVLLVTHNIQDICECDRIILVQEKKIIECGSHDDLMNQKGIHENTLNLKGSKSNIKAGKIINPVSDSTGNPKWKTTTKTPSNGTLMTKEGSSDGNIPSEVIHKYVQYAGGYWITIPVILTFALNVGSLSFSSWWLSYWLDAGSGNTVVTVGNETFVSSKISDNPHREFYMSIYAWSIAGILFFSLLRGFAFMKATIRASSKMHDEVFGKVFSCPMSFFDTTPMGRTLNLFSRDLDEADVSLPRCMETFLQNIWVVIASLMFVCWFFPLFLIFLAFLGTAFVFLRNVFRISIRDLKRKENLSRSPLYSHIATSISGLSSLQAYNKKELFTSLFMNLYDENSGIFFLYNFAVRWLSIRLDILAVLVTSATVLFSIAFRGVISAAYAGLALSYAGQLSGVFQYTVRLSIETEAKFTSVQRIINYITSLRSEENEKIPTLSVDAVWPKSGQIIFKDVRMQYRPDTPTVLKGINFVVNAREKIGVIGRTGGGKSTLGVVLFRLVDLSRGSISIDGVDISRIPLATLRSRLSVIPQDPVLFVGTVRYNLDPFCEFSDEEIWKVLEETSMKEHISSLNANLLSPVIENGENFSVGERQLLCMARALLRNSKIIFLDEATAGVDSETDLKIQQTLQKAFHDCTTITVAHRLDTVRKCDRILVLEDGKVVNYCTPKELNFSV